LEVEEVMAANVNKLKNILTEVSEKLEESWREQMYRQYVIKYVGLASNT
jgi:hypothetical protein